PLHVEKPEELVAPYWVRKMATQVWGTFSYPNYVDLREQSKSFSSLCAVTGASAGISSGDGRNAGDSDRAEGAWREVVSGNVFVVMGVKAMLGRVVSPEEDRAANAHRVTVMSHSVWRQRFNRDQGVVGKTIYLNDHPFTVVVVMPESFLGLIFYFRL